MKSTKLLLGVLILSAILSSNSCEKGTPSGIPYVPVNLQLTVSNPQFSSLLAVGGWLYIGGGSQGLIVYRFSPDEFRAYDRHCTFQVIENCQLHMDNTDITAVDSNCCASKFLIIDGAPIDGPANIGLHQYNTSFDGNTLLIFN